MFNTKKIPHSHPCECHIIENKSMKDQEGKKWTQKELDSHIESLTQPDTK
tara:strand:+ start:2537 stop:2686 length:150 start_codon:yes stop_codon:yes gene_type:complete